MTSHARIFGFRWHNSDESRVINVEIRDLSIGSIWRGIFIFQRMTSHRIWNVDRISSCEGENKWCNYPVTASFFIKNPFVQWLIFRKSIEQHRWMKRNIVAKDLLIFAFNVAKTNQMWPHAHRVNASNVVVQIKSYKTAMKRF